MKFFLGTTNPGKIREIGAILTPLGCDLEVTEPIDPEETEPDFLGNAVLKQSATQLMLKGSPFPKIQVWRFRVSMDSPVFTRRDLLIANLM